MRTSFVCTLFLALVMGTPIFKRFYIVHQPIPPSVKIMLGLCQSTALNVMSSQHGKIPVVYARVLYIAT